MSVLQWAADYGAMLVALVLLILGAIGFIAGVRRNGGDAAHERWVEQERRLEREEDTRDSGPI